MTRHEWRAEDEAGVRIWRARRARGAWEFISRLKTEEDWSTQEALSDDQLREFRERLWRKYQRRRIPWEHVAELDRELEAREEAAREAEAEAREAEEEAAAAREDGDV